MGLEYFNFKQIDFKEVQKLPFEIRFIFDNLHLGDRGGLRFTKVVNNEFYFFVDYNELIHFWESIEKLKVVTENLEPVNYDNVIPYYKKFAEGFFLGYNNYEKNILNKSSIFGEQSNFAMQIFADITERKSYLTHYAMKDIDGKHLSTLSEKIWFENGQSMGANYKAWQIIINNSWQFSELFLNTKMYIEHYKNSLEYYSKEKMYLGVFQRLQETIKKIPPQQNETKTDKLKAELGKYGFFELSKVKQLSEPNKQSLIELISTNNLPYSISMFEYLGFLKYLKAEHLKADYNLFKEVSKWFGVTDRAVKGNIYVLNEFSKENRTRYTADQQKQRVQKDYEKLK